MENLRKRKDIQNEKDDKKILIGAGTAVTGIGMLSAISHSISKKLMELALDREAPKAMSKKKEKLKGSKEVIEYMEDLSASADKLKNSQYEDVTTTSQDGLCLVGHWRTCENPKRVIIAMHGWRSSWDKDFGTIADLPLRMQSGSMWWKTTCAFPIVCTKQLLAIFVKRKFR